MTFRKFGQIGLAAVASLGICFGLTSCTRDYTVAYFYVTGAQYNQIGAYKEDNDTGVLRPAPGSPFGSAGVHPIRDLVLTGGRYLYVLNQGQTTYAGDGVTPIANTRSNIANFSIGGNGTLGFQQTYTSQGSYPIRFGTDSSGRYFYVLDEYAPTAEGTVTSPVATSDMPCQDAAGFHPQGEITAFTIDSTTGRLSLLTNQQQQNAQGTQLTYFPVGCFPADFYVSSGYIFTANYSPSSMAANQNTVFVYGMNAASGQLTLTQNAPLQTGALSISAINGNSKYVYILDPAANMVRPFTVGSNGSLQSQTNGPINNGNNSRAGNPQQLIVDSSGKFLYVANAGPSGGISNPSSDISAYTIDASGTLANVGGSPFSTSASGTTCILQDPSKQYIYTGGYDSSKIAGALFDPNSGVLAPLRKGTDFPTVGNPTYCVASGVTD